MSAKLSILVQRVRAALQNDSRTHDAAVDVVEEGGSITLTGTVATENGRQAAGEIARKQEGVIQVINELQIETHGPEDEGSVVAQPAQQAHPPLMSPRPEVLN